MKAFAIFTAFLYVVTPFVMGDDNDLALGEKIADAARFLRQMESNRIELQNLNQMRNSDVKMTPEQAARVIELSKEASEACSRAKEIVGMVKPGNSVFHYPGLLSMGDIRYRPTKDEYTLSVYTGDHTYVDFSFNSTGSISDIRRQVPIR